MPTAEQIEIRRLNRQDAQGFYRLRLEALEQEPHAFAESPDEHRQMTIELILKLGSDSAEASNIVLGACIDDLFIGMAGLSQYTAQKTRHKARIWGVYVKPEWRRKGVARVLISELLERARAIPGLEQIVLSVGTGQSAARQLYASLGFKAYGREERALRVGDNYVDEELMVLHLNR